MGSCGEAEMPSELAILCDLTAAKPTLTGGGADSAFRLPLKIHYAIGRLSLADGAPKNTSEHAR
jgi:hypothetical protein